MELINPEIVESDGVQNRSEACLSIPGRSGTVERPLRVKIKALDRNGAEFFAEGSDLTAVAYCHELDHLDGVLFIEKATDIQFHEDSGEEDAEGEDAGLDGSGPI
jgi:peptide deformylase